MGDNDLGDHFLNFILADKYRRLSGVYLGYYIPNKKYSKTHWEMWGRALMGFKPSPYVAVQGTHVAQDFAMGDRKDKRNVF